MKDNYGVLYIIATPIGNLEDITLRALNILKGVDFIAAEDTRHTIKLLNHYEIKKTLLSYHEHNKYEKGNEIIELLKSGKNIGLVSDAGTPAISDPGEDLVKLCIENNIRTIPIPGATALISALIVSGKDTKKFVFEGFLSQEKNNRKNVLEKIKDETRTIILYEAPHKIKKTLVELLKYLGNRNITLVRELTKKYEEIRTYTIEEAIVDYSQREPRGEYVLVIEGKPEIEVSKEKAQIWEELTLDEHMEYYLKKDMVKKEVIKQIAKDRNINKREVYNHFINEKDK